MADTKISALAELAIGGVADLDELVIVDKSDTSMAASGTDKRMVALTMSNYAALNGDTVIAHRIFMR